MRVVRQAYADDSQSGLLKLHDDGSTRPLPEDDPSYLEWLDAGGEVDILPYVAPGLASLQEEAIARLQAEKWNRIHGTYRDTKGNLYAIDADSWALLCGEVAVLGAAGQTLEPDYVWKIAETNAQGAPIYVPHDAESLIALSLEIRAYINNVFRASETAQAAVRTAGDAAGVATAEASVAWPVG